MIYLITGGQRSGKSRYAQTLALSLTDTPVYVATARLWDEEFEQRIDRHKKDRDGRWTSIECEKELSSLALQRRVVVIDCITLWLTNYFVDTNEDVNRSLKLAKEEFDQLINQEATFIFITNELGMGSHALSKSGRKFTDLQGWMNQHAAAKADEVILMVSGIPHPIKKVE